VTHIADDDYEQELFKDVCSSAMELCVNIGLFTTVSSHWPENVRANWEERLKATNEWLQTQIEEVQSFAEAFDG
jgi:hypothetical protein